MKLLPLAPHPDFAPWLAKGDWIKITRLLAPMRMSEAQLEVRISEAQIEYLQVRDDMDRARRIRSNDAHLGQIIGAMEKLDRLLAKPETGQTLRDAYVNSVLEGEGFRSESRLFYTHEEFLKQLRINLGTYRRAHGAKNINTVRKLDQTGLVQALLHIYEDATGKVPGYGDSPVELTGRFPDFFRLATEHVPPVGKKKITERSLRKAIEAYRDGKVAGKKR